MPNGADRPSAKSLLSVRDGRRGDRHRAVRQVVVRGVVRHVADVGQDVHARHDLPENRVLVIEKRRRVGRGDEEFGAAGVVGRHSGQAHDAGAGVFAAAGSDRPRQPGLNSLFKRFDRDACRRRSAVQAGLGDEAGDDAVEIYAVVGPGIDKVFDLLRPCSAPRSGTAR